MQLVKTFRRLTITAIYRGGRNCHLVDTKQEEPIRKAEPAQRDKSICRPNVAFVSSSSQVLIYKATTPPTALDYPKLCTLI